MADVWAAIIKDWATGNAIAESHLDEEIRNRMTVLSLAVDGDLSTSTIKHRHLTGTLAARPAAGELGRLYYATDTKISFLDDGTQWVPIGVQVLDHDLTQVDITNVATEQTVFEHTLPAGILGATGGVRLTMYGDLLVNVAGNLILRTRLPSGIILTSTNIDPSDSANRRKWRWIVEMVNSAANAQKWGIHFEMSPAHAGEWPVTGADIWTGIGIEASSDDTSAAVLLRATAHWSGASASLSFRKEQAVLELLPPA